MRLPSRADRSLGTIARGAASSIAVGACFDFGDLHGGVVDASQSASSDAGESDSSLASDAAPSLGCPLGCLPPAPSGWTGPSAVYEGPASTKPAACPTAYTQKEIDGFEGLDAGAAQCGCGTPTFSGGSCEDSVVTYPTAGCSGAGAILDGTITKAAPCLTLVNDGYVKVVAGATSPGTCTFKAPTTTIPDAGFAAVDLSCGLPETAQCSGASACIATPIPDAPFTRLCIHQSGDVACPSADYAQRFVSYASIDDTPSCSACVGTTTGGSCTTDWGITASETTCLSTPPTGSAAGFCTGTAQGVGTVIGATLTLDALGCLADGGGPDGSVEAENPVTFCCNK